MTTLIARRALSALRTSTPRHVLSVFSRSLATPTSNLPIVIPEQPRTDGPLRPHLNIPVDPNHGLYAFFRKSEEDGEVHYETTDAPDAPSNGRSWTAPELRRKSFKDLHTLWYVVLRERNLLATQREEMRRVGATMNVSRVQQKMARCRKTMARIKYVINERRVAYEGAIKILTERRERVAKKEMKSRLRVAAAEPTVEPEEPKTAKVSTDEKNEAAKLAAEGMFTAAPPAQTQV